MIVLPLTSTSLKSSQLNSGAVDAVAGEDELGVLDRRAVGHVLGPRDDLVRAT